MFYILYTRKLDLNNPKESCIFDATTNYYFTLMQRTLIVLLPLLLLFGFSSCEGETESGDINFENNPLKGRHLTHSFHNDVHLIELYTRDTILHEGYNNLLLRIKDKNDTYISYADVEWEIRTNDNTTGPHTEVERSIDNPDVYTSSLIFPKNTHSKSWTLKLTYQIQSTTYNADTNLTVFKSDENSVNIYEGTGTDNREYLLALSDPYKPINGYNNCSLLIYEKYNSEEYEIRKDLNVHVWLSKENYVHDVVVELPFRDNSNKYQGKVEIIDSGLWQLNMVVKNEQNDIILGKERSANQPNSSLHFPLLTGAFIND